MRLLKVSAKRRYAVISRWAHFFIWWAKISCGIQYQVTGLEHRSAQNAIICANHQSMWETLFMTLLFPFPQSWILKKELLSLPLLGTALRCLNPIVIDREDLTSVKQILREGEERLRDGWGLILFPEGTRVAIGEERRFSRSAAALALRSGYAIVPVAHNAGRFWPKGFFIKQSGVIQVVVGKPIVPDGLSAAELTDRIENWIRAQGL